jgi:hypothetical protein
MKTLMSERDGDEFPKWEFSGIYLLRGIAFGCVDVALF